MAVLSFQLNSHLFVRDPQHTQLGQNIISKSVEMIDHLGFEQFTFKKLADEIESTEASIYRYFENKHRLLLYLVAWYWSWIEYRIDLATNLGQRAEDRLATALKVIVEEKQFDPSFAFVDEVALHRIVVSELDKTYLTKWVDKDNEEGLFGGFKSLCKKIAGMVIEINPRYPYPNSLISTVLLAAKQQAFFSIHLPSLTNVTKDVNGAEQINKFINRLVFDTIKS
ncbi:MAG TPA: TetR/AcrR family transcriptional regulator [Cyclobacteriaceae bacterium]|nr:TetR/AcrR family transcriptional regulator [Cyclobacteriaceae bacterium]